MLFSKAQTRLLESSKKLDLIRHSLEMQRKELPQDSPKVEEIQNELHNVLSPASPGSYSPSPTAFENFRRQGAANNQSVGKRTHSLNIGKTAAVTGKLEVR